MKGVMRNLHVEVEVRASRRARVLVLRNDSDVSIVFKLYREKNTRRCIYTYTTLATALEVDDVGSRLRLYDIEAARIAGLAEVIDMGAIADTIQRVGSASVVPLDLSCRRLNGGKDESEDDPDSSQLHLEGRNWANNRNVRLLRVDLDSWLSCVVSSFRKKVEDER